MIDLGAINGFQWDRGNKDKSFQKHGITPAESEELFLDPYLIVTIDDKHSDKELRYQALGVSTQGNLIYAVFTIRDDLIRLISVRMANKKERREYEKTTQTDS